MLKGIKAHTVYVYIHKQTQILNDANKLRSAVELNKQRDTVFTVILYLTVLCRLEWICILMYLPKEKCLKTNYSKFSLNSQTPLKCLLKNQKLSNYAKTPVSFYAPV